MPQKYLGTLGNTTRHIGDLYWWCCRACWRPSWVATYTFKKKTA